jgi:hypothetical protein
MKRNIGLRYRKTLKKRWRRGIQFANCIPKNCKRELKPM